MRRRMLIVAAAAVAMCTSLACGTTLQATGQRGDNLSAGGGQGLGGPGAGTTGPGANGLGGPGANGAGGAGAGSTGAGANSLGGSGSLGGSAAIPPGKAPLLIGAAYERNANTGDSSLGASNNDPGDFKADYTALIKYINAHGGIAGHPLTPVWYEFDVTSSESVSTQEQRACDTWTHDHHVFAILIGQSDLMKTCAKNAGIVQISVEASSTDSTGFARYPALVEITTVGLDRIGPATVSGLQRMHYFDGVKSRQLGIVTWDEPQFKHGVEHGYLPALGHLGLSIANPHRAYLHVPDNAADVAATSNDARAAALRFAQDGVTHVMILDGHAGIATGGVVHLEFMLNAEALHYRPRYGLNGTAAYSAGAGTYPKAQQHGAVGISWSPSDDPDASPDTHAGYYMAQKRCLTIFRDAGIVATNPNAEANLYGTCDELFFMQLVASRVSGSLTTSSFIGSVARLGSLFPPADTFATSFAGRRDGASEGRDIEFVDSCTCYRYVGGRFAI